MSKRKALFAVASTIGGAFIYAAASQLTHRFFEKGQEKKFRTKQGNRKESITFDDVAGYEYVLKSFNEVISYFKDPNSFTRVGASHQQGILLYGPPGTGKTHMAKALAGELKASFFYASGSEMIEQFVGVGAARIRKLFEQASKEAPSVVFIDEIDAIGAKRSSSDWNREHDQALTELLVSLDGFETKNRPIVLIAATNRLEVLDEALTRPGRFNRKIYVGLPDEDTRHKILAKLARDKPMPKDLNLSVLAKSTEGWSGADLKNLLEQAATYAAVEKSEIITYSHIKEAFDTIHAESRDLRNEKPDDLKGEDTHRRNDYELWQEVKLMFDEAAPNMDPIRKQTLKLKMIEFDEWFEDHANDLSSRDPGNTIGYELLGFANQLRSISASDPLLGLREKGSTISANSREERILLDLNKLSLLCIDFTHKSGVNTTRDSAITLSMDLKKLITEMSQYGNDSGKFRQIELERARPLSQDVRKHLKENNIMIARPIWSLSHLTPIVEPGLVFFSGNHSTEHQLAASASNLGLRLSPRSALGRDFADCRWTEIRKADLAMFDISNRNPQVYYELGIALALGSEILILALEDTIIPFDIKIGITFYSPPNIDGEMLEKALDSAIYNAQTVATNCTSRDITVERLKQIMDASDPNTQSILRFALRAILNGVQKDTPQRFGVNVKSFLAWLPFSAEQLIYPRWPAAYPKQNGDKRCFIVMPFNESFSSASQLYFSVLQEHGILPIRGDSLSTADNIIHAIWEEICIADFVLADLTDFNPNVCLELGIAHTLGKPVLLVGAKGTEVSLSSELPNVAHMRCHLYEDINAFRGSLSQIIELFIDKLP